MFTGTKWSYALNGEPEHLWLMKTFYEYRAYMRKKVLYLIAPIIEINWLCKTFFLLNTLYFSEKYFSFEKNNFRKEIRRQIIGQINGNNLGHTYGAFRQQYKFSGWEKNAFHCNLNFSTYIFSRRGISSIMEYHLRLKKYDTSTLLKPETRLPSQTSTACD